MVNDVSYSDDIRNLIIGNLDGWIVDVPGQIVDGAGSDNEEGVEGNDTESTTSKDITPFITSTELENKANKVITDDECRLFYEEALDQSFIHTNRLNIDDLTEIESRMFIRGVCKWAASNLWNKYNIRVNNEDMEDTYIQSYGGLLYKSALKILHPFINQRINSSSSINKDAESDKDVWII